MTEEDIDEIGEAATKLEDLRHLYERRIPLRWVVFIIYVAIGTLIGYEIPTMRDYIQADNSFRGKIDEFLHDTVGDKFFD